jgi:hypothetical protein
LLLGWQVPSTWTTIFCWLCILQTFFPDWLGIRILFISAIHSSRCNCHSYWSCWILNRWPNFLFILIKILALSMNIFELSFILPSSRSFVNATK